MGPELTNWPSGTHKGTERERGDCRKTLAAPGIRTLAKSDRVFRAGNRPVSSSEGRHRHVIAGEGPIGHRHTNLADCCGLTTWRFWLRPLMRTRRPVG